MENLSQFVIFVFGVSAIFISQSSDKSLVKWSCIAGLIAQPFWFYSSYISGQWGIFSMSFFYTFAWAKGIKTYWLGK